MRAMFGVLALLVVALVVMQLVRTQLKSLPAGPVVAGSAAAPAGPRAQQQQIADEIVKAMQLGQQRAASSAD